MIEDMRDATSVLQHELIQAEVGAKRRCTPKANSKPDDRSANVVISKKPHEVRRRAGKKIDDLFPAFLSSSFATATFLAEDIADNAP